MKDRSSIPKRSLTTQIEQAALQNDKQTLVGLIHLIVFTTSMIGGGVMYFYDINSHLSLFLLGFVCFFGWILNRAGHSRSSAVILIAALLIVIQFNVFSGYGIHDVAIIAWPAFIFFSGLLFGWRVIPYVTTLIMGLAIVTKIIPNAQFFFDYSDTGDLIVMLLILLAFSIIAISLLRGNEHLIQHLQQSDERYQAIYNSINDAIFIHDAQTGILLDVNDRMLEMFGYTHREALLLDLLAISSGIPPYTQQNALERIRKAAAEGTQQFEWQVKDKSGRLFWVDVNMKSATIAKQSRILVSVRDITERRQADEELLKFKLGIERSADAIFITDPQGVIVYTNPAFEKIYGYTQSEAVERTPQILKSGLVPPEQYQQFWATLLNKDIVAGEIINKTKDGRLIAIEGSNNPILDAAGNIIGFLGVHRDISERKRAEEQVRNSEKRFQALIKHGRDNISLLTADGTLLWESPSVDNTLGYTPNQFVGHNIFELMHPDDQAWTSNMYAQVVQSPGNIQEGVFRLLHADGTWRWIECAATNLLEEPGVQAIVINYRDITERKHAEEEIARMALALDIAPNSITIHDFDGRFLYANQQTFDLHGYTRDEFMRLTLREIDVPASAELISSRMQELRDRGEANFQVEHFRKDGTILPLEIHIRLTTWGDIKAILSIATDITKRKRAEDVLRESEERYRTLFQQASDGIFYLSTDGKILAVNESFARMHGYRMEEMQGMSLQDLDTPENVQQIPERMRRIMAGEIIEFESEHYHKDGHTFPLAVSTGLVSIGGKQLIQAFHRDITERKRAEEALRESETRFRSFIEQSSEGMILIDEQNRIIEWNSAQEKITGIARAEALGAFYWDIQYRILPPERKAQRSPEYFKNVMTQSLAAGHIPGSAGLIETVIQTTAGELKPILQVSFLIRTESGYRIGAVVRDITEQEDAEKALQESEARLRAVVQTAKDAIITMDMQGSIVDWNAAAETTFCFSRAEALGMPVSCIMPEPFRSSHQHSVENASTSGERRVVGKTIETTGLTNNGREFPIEISLSEWKTQAGNFFTAVIRDITDRKQRENELQAIVTLSAALRTAPNRAEILPVIIEQLSKLLLCDSISVEIIDPTTNESVVEAAYGAWIAIVGFRQPAETGMNAILSRTRRPHLNNNVKKGSRVGVSAYSMDKVLASAGVPLIAQDQVIGFLWIGHSQEIAENEVRLLAAVADIAANAIHRTTLHEQTQKDAADLARAYDTTLEGWARALEFRDHETEGHARRVVQLTVDLARAMGIGEGELVHVRRGALLHDIGKMGIPDSILLKPGALDEREWEIMQHHPEYAYTLLEPIEYLHPAFDIPYCHHERWDGTGYPRNLKGDQIPLAARIFAIVDVWDALTSDRSYRLAWSQEKALEHIAKQSGRHFDPAVVDAFLKII
jgi:PAS domain S-box-containing protein